MVAFPGFSLALLIQCSRVSAGFPNFSYLSHWLILSRATRFDTPETPFSSVSLYRAQSHNVTTTIHPIFSTTYLVSVFNLCIFYLIVPPLLFIEMDNMLYCLFLPFLNLYIKIEANALVSKFSFSAFWEIFVSSSFWYNLFPNILHCEDFKRRKLS